MAGGMYGMGALHGMGYTWQEMCMVGVMHGRGAFMACVTNGCAWQGGMCGSRDALHGRGCDWQRACMAGGMQGSGVYGRGHAWWVACMARKRGHAWQGGERACMQERQLLK